MNRFVAPAQAIALLAVARWDAAVGVLPVLRVLRGDAAWALAGLALGIAVVPSLRWRVPAVGARTLLAVAALLYAGVALYYVERLQASGDEPHYLLMAQSLWNEGDLDLEDNYAREDFLDYTPGPLVPHYGAPRADGRPYPAHSPGLPALLAPVYALWGRRGCVLLLALLAAWLTVEVWRLARHATGDAEAALVAWAAALGAPIAFYAFHVYTEIPSALCLVVALRLLVTGRGVAAAAGAAAMAVALPWLHVKLIPAAAALGAIGVVRLEGRPRGVFIAAAAAGALSWAAYYQAIFGQPTPLAIYGGVPTELSSSPLRALAGLLLDRSFGLLPCAPIFLLGLAGLAPWARAQGRRAWPWALALASVLLPVLPWRMWWGGFCPPARFLVPAVPLLALAVAWRVAAGRRGLARWRWALVALGLCLSAYAVHRPVDRLLLDRRARPTRLWSWLSEAPGTTPGLGRYLPSLVASEPHDTRLAALWLALLAGLVLLDRASHRPAVDAAFRGLTLPLLVLLAGGALADLWARPPPVARVVVASDLLRPQGTAVASAMSLQRTPAVPHSRRQPN